MFVHIGLYSVLGHHEWAMASENWSPREYEKLADRFKPAPECAREWARLAKSAGMKYMILTTRHHEGFSLWDSAVNPFNSVNYGPKRDIVREFAEACRENGLRIGFYSSLMDWHHPDGGRSAYDSDARKRFTDYIYSLNEELLSNYGKIDILWYDVARPMETFEGWNSLEMNQRLRALQPDIIINNRSLLPEDFGTPEERVVPEEGRDWESCMTFNGLSWGYIDSKQAEPYSYNAPRILRMLAVCASNGGNLLLNIGPGPDGSIPPESREPLKAVGKWLSQNGEGVYGKLYNFKGIRGVGGRLLSLSRKGNTVYAWNWIWPESGDLIIAGLTGKLRSARLLWNGRSLSFTQEKYRINFGVPLREDRDPLGVTVIALEFEHEPGMVPYAAQPPLTLGRVWDV
jgi:alpha-L-fucosidase